MLKSRTEKGLHIPFNILFDLYTSSVLFKRSSHWIFFLSGYFILNCSNLPPSPFVYLGTQRVEASFRSCIPVTNSHFAAVIRFLIPIETYLHIVNSRLFISTNFILQD
ncbi:hypothetical protein ACN38_g4636 [Penicillium nordicum]|uniref:Uncharacterized protein n=1 Tax=Penicillium nordicum TaxID=229535 RepID=A0A0M8PB39_9EURO|nr:hypothetical protein ACN38_g4636 [Penicillium nordicum]